MLSWEWTRALWSSWLSLWFPTIVNAEVLMITKISRTIPRAIPTKTRRRNSWLHKVKMRSKKRLLMQFKILLGNRIQGSMLSQDSLTWTTSRCQCNQEWACKCNQECRCLCKLVCLCNNRCQCNNKCLVNNKWLCSSKCLKIRIWAFTWFKTKIPKPTKVI